jgi:hypothetical protein
MSSHGCSVGGGGGVVKLQISCFGSQGRGSGLSRNEHWPGALGFGVNTQDNGLS